MNFFQMFTGSFHSAAVYREVRAKATFNMGYTALLVLFCTLLTTIYYGHLFHRELFVARDGKPALFDDVLTQIASQIPVMTYQNGKLVTNEPHATVITISGQIFGETFEKQPLITIDTTGQTTHENMQTAVLITSSDFVVKTERETKIRPLSEYNDKNTTPLVINRAMAMDTAEKFIGGVHSILTQFYLLVGGVVWMMFAFVAYILRIIMLLGLGLIGTVIGAILKSPMSYGAAVSLAAVSFTPIALLETAVLVIAGYTVHTLTLLVAGSVALAAAIKVSTPAPVTPN